MSGDNCERSPGDGVRSGHVDHDTLSSLRASVTSVVSQLHRRLQRPEDLLKHRAVALLIHPVPVDRLRPQVVRFGIEVPVSQVQQAEPAASNFMNIFAGGCSHSGFQVSSSHEKTPDGEKENDRPTRSSR